MANDNTLGAPTEGLGQTVTFATSGRQGVPQMQAAQRGALRTGGSGGEALRTSQALQVQEARPDPTFQALARLGGELLKPHIEAERNASYMKGFQRAAQNEAISEIVDEQPWYSKLFGPTNLVDGARAYTASAQAANIATQIEADMPNLRKLSGDEFSRHMAQQMTSANTGDDATNMMVQASVINSMAGTAKIQAKAHLRYKQEVLETGRKNNVSAQATRLWTLDQASRSPNSTVELGDAGTSARQVLDSLVVPANEDVAHFYKTVGEPLVSAVANGNFAAFDLLEGSKRLDAMPVDLQTSLRRAHSIARSEARIKLPLDFANKIDALEALSRKADATPEVLRAATDKLNAEYTQITGDRTPLRDIAHFSQDLGTLRRTQELEAARLDHAKANAATQAEREQLDQNDTIKVAGMLATGVDVRGYPRGKVQDAWAYTAQTTADKSKLSAIRAGQAARGNIDEGHEGYLRNSIQAALANGDGPSLHLLYTNEYLPLVKAAGEGREDIAQKYVGAYGDVMAKYHSYVLGMRNAPMGVTEQRVAYSTAVAPTPPKSSKEQVTTATSELTHNWLGAGFTRLGDADFVTLKDPKGLAAQIAGHMSPVLPAKTAVLVAQSKVDGLTVLGGHWWVRPVGSSTVQGREVPVASRLDEWLLTSESASTEMRKVANNEQNRAIEHSIGLAVTAGGLVSSQIVQGRDDPLTKEPVLFVHGMNEYGEKRIIIVTGDQIKRDWHAKQTSSVFALPNSNQVSMPPPEGSLATVVKQGGSVNPRTLLPIK